MNKEYIVIPMGDPAGVGPEIVVKSLAKSEIIEKNNLIVVGDRKILEKAIDICNVKLRIKVIQAPKEGNYTEGILNLIDLDNIDLDTFEYGQVQAQCGQAAFDYIKTAIDLCLSGEVVAMATTTLNKEAFKAAGINYIGHSEILEDLTHTQNPLTMFQVKDLRVFFYSKHVPLKKACELITYEGIQELYWRSKEALEVLGVKEPKIAVAGLNPHSGEHGLFGTEEVDYVIPAVNDLQAKGEKVYGPIGADSVFYQALNGKYDAVLSLYHDQGHIATKMVDFNRTVSFTHNLPFLRTSVDHGTAFDIAGKGIASEISLDEAIYFAGLYANAFRHKGNN